MLFQPPSWPRRRSKPTAAAYSVPSGYACLVLWTIAAALCSASPVVANEEFARKLTGGMSRGLLADVTAVFQIADATEFSNTLSSVRNMSRVEFVLAPGSYVFASTQSLTMAITIRGASASSGLPSSILSCGSDGMTSLLDFSGSELALLGVQLQDCTCPGLRISSLEPATITIQDSVFTSFVRTLDTDRDLSKPDAPADIQTSTAALAVHAGSFTGTLLVRNSIFTDNHFVTPNQRRRLLADEGEDRLAGVADSLEDAGGSTTLIPRPDNLDGYIGITSGTLLRKHRRRGLSVPIWQPNPWADEMSERPWKMVGGDRERDRTRRQLMSGDATRYSMPYLEKAELMHPGLEAGPWADDLEAAFTVVCVTDGCDIKFQDVIISDNTGVATGGLYVLCDGATSCGVNLLNCTVTNNTLLWQEATDVGNPSPRPLIVESSDYGTPPPADSSEPVEVPTPAGVLLFQAMVPWLTYTYPLIETYQQQDNVKGTLLADVSLYPRVTGRTLGAVVLHQRNSPWPGVSTRTAPMMNVAIVGGTYNGNDGSAIMSTATDFMKMAGGNGTWSGDAPRHSADLAISGVTISDHSSGWPAIWLRWARTVNISDCQISKSTGAVWMDEVRDEALVEDSNFNANKLSGLWLDYFSFLNVFLVGGTPSLGYPTSHVVKIQMTPLGELVANNATVSNCRFKGNPSSSTGVLYIRASDVNDVDVDNQPGTTQVLVAGTNITTSTCMSSPGPCQSGERPLFLVNLFSASVQSCRFTNNLNGGIYLYYVHSAIVGGGSLFDSNLLSYAVADSAGGDNSYGGAGIFGMHVGSGGIRVTGTTFSNNTAAIGGGAVYLQYFEFAVFSNSSFTSNTAATFDGGAIWMGNARGTQTAVTGSIFTSNRAGRHGGAISASNIAPGSSIGWQVTGNSVFNDNLALLNPARRGPAVLDQAGGGAIFASSATLLVQDATMIGNKVFGHAGGAIRIVDSVTLQLVNVNFEDNVAIMGGAVAASRLSSFSNIKNCNFKNNTVVDPWAWPDTTSLNLSVNRPSLSFIDPGYGGALYMFSADITLYNAGSFVRNSAKYGGAVAIISASTITIMAESSSAMDRVPISNISVSSAVSQAASLVAEIGASPTLPYRCLFMGNTALIGGAFYLYDVQSVNFNLDLVRQAPVLGHPGLYQYTPDSIKVFDQPGILFYQNRANGGGAIYSEDNGQANLMKCRFVENSAVVPPLAPNYSGLYGRETDSATAKVHPCYNGGGGAICVIGKANKNILISSSDMISNTAKDGAGIYIAEGSDCQYQASCYKVILNRVNMTGNTATNRGGAVFWMHEGILQIASCSSDKVQTFAASGAFLNGSLATGNASTNATINATIAMPPYNVSLVTPGRKGPANWYSRLTYENQGTLLSTGNGSARASTSYVWSVDGKVASDGLTLFVASAAANATTVTADLQVVAASGAFLTDSGILVVNRTSVNSSTWLPVDGMPVLLNSTVVNDTTWMGIPYTSLPCANWQNSANTGSDISTTPFFLVTPPRLDFYTSNTDIKINVTVHDWFGQQCVGDSSTQPLVIVQADSTEVSGAVTVPAANGSADFSLLRLRAKEGVHIVGMTGQLYAPVRELLKAEVQISVRPCAINEFLSPKNLDECIACDPSSYNLNASAVTCQPCPDNTQCGYPDPAACKYGDDGCDPVGFMVPKDGYWHVNFFSEEVLECPNSDSCTSANRSRDLSGIQLKIWQAARNIQLNASNVVADKASMAAVAHLLSSASGQRRLLQDKAISDVVNVQLVLLATAAYRNEYQQNQCAEGYMGTLCGECMPGYGWRKIATCGKCPSRALNNLYYALVTILTIGLLAFTVYSSLKEQRMPGKLVGGVLDKGKNKAAKVNPSITGHGHVQGSVPSASAAQYHAMLAANGSNPGDAMADLHDESDGSLPEGEPTNHDDYVESVVAAARAHYASAPGTPKGRAAPPIPFPNFETALRAHSVLGFPMRGVVRSPRPEPPRVPSHWTRVQTSHGSYSIPRPGPVAEATDYTSGSYSIPRPGPVAEATDYTNVLYDDNGVEIPQVEDAGAQPEVQAAEAEPAVIPSAALPPGMPAGVMLQSVPVMQGSPPRTPPHQVASPVVVVDTQPAERPPPTEKPRRRNLYARQRAHQSTVVKIFVSYVQVLALLQNVPLDIPGVVDVYYRINNQAISYPGILVSLDCSLPSSGVSKAIVRVILTVLAPLYIFAGSVVFFLLYNVLDYYVIMPWYAKRVTKKRKKRQLRLPTYGMHMDTYFGRQLIVTFITIFFFFYPSVVHALMTIFNCQDVNTRISTNPLAVGMGIQAERVWSQDFSLECYKGPHLALTLGLGVPGVLLIAIGWPLMSALFMTGKLPCMNNIRFTEEMTEFFLADFKSNYAWWESVVMLRKLLIAVIVTLLDGPTSAGVQLLLVICILVVATGLQMGAMPYHHAYTNNLEFASLGTLLATLYLSLYFSFSSSISDGGRITVSVLILAVNIIMVAVFIYYIVQAYWFAALYSTGLSDISREDRRKLTPAELQRRILENLTSQGSTTSYMQDGQPPEHERSSYHHVAGLYAAAVWASMRVGSTTSKVLTRVRTMLPAQQLSLPPSREGSQSGAEPHDTDGDGVPTTEAVRKRLNRDADTIPEEDPESGLGSGSNSKRSSQIGVVPVERSSVPRTSHPAAAKAVTVSVPSPSRTSASSAAGKAVAANGPPKDEAGGSAGSASNTSACCPSVTRESSATSCDNPRLPPFPTELDVDAPMTSPDASALAAGASSNALRANGPRAQSRLAAGSGHSGRMGERSGELLPPPPMFSGAFTNQAKP